MAEYNIIGTYEPGSLEDVVGEIEVTGGDDFSQNKKGIDPYLNRVPLPILVAAAGLSGVVAVREIYNIFSALHRVIQ